HGPQGTPPFERGERQKRAGHGEGRQYAPPGRAAHEALFIMEDRTLQVDTVTSAAAVELRHLDNLWIQVSGTRCNIECRHCFNNSSPRQTAFGLMTLEAVNGAIAGAAARGVR